MLPSTVSKLDFIQEWVKLEKKKDWKMESAFKLEMEGSYLQCNHSFPPPQPQAFLLVEAKFCLGVYYLLDSSDMNFSSHSKKQKRYWIQSGHNKVCLNHGFSCIPDKVFLRLLEGSACTVNQYFMEFFSLTFLECKRIWFVTMEGTLSLWEKTKTYNS